MQTEMIKSSSLYQIRQDHLNILREIEDMDGELTPELEQALQLTEGEFQQKALSYGYIIKSFSDTSEIIDKEIKRLQELKEKANKRHELFKQRLDDAMQQFGIEKITSPVLSISYRKSKAVKITDENLIGTEFWILQAPKISKTLIKAAMDKGEIVHGAELVEHKNLQIK